MTPTLAIRTHARGVALLLLAFCRAAPVLAAEPPAPETIVTLADVEQVLGGKFTSSSPEPGVLFYQEEGGGYRGVEVYLWPAAGKTVAAMTAQLIQEGEPVDAVSGIDDAAMYRPQQNEATVERKDKSGEVLWLSIAVRNASNAEATKRLAIELAKRGAPRI
jgi:hypothetical protein